jgi:uracil phosphoribosyltransferase
MSTLHLISHPLVQHKLTLMRQKDASTNSFRRLLDELSTLMAYEVTRDMPLQDVEIETPLETMTGQMIDGKKLVLVSILRAGDGFLDGMLRVVPVTSSTKHISRRVNGSTPTLTRWLTTAPASRMQHEISASGKTDDRIRNAVS